MLSLKLKKIRQNTIDYSFAGWRVIGTLAWIGYVAGDCIKNRRSVLKHDTIDFVALFSSIGIWREGVKST